MGIAVNYREYAARCVKAAQQVADLSTKGSLLDMAQVWLMLADHAEKHGSLDLPKVDGLLEQQTESP